MIDNKTHKVLNTEHSFFNLIITQKQNKEKQTSVFSLIKNIGGFLFGVLSITFTFF